MKYLIKNIFIILTLTISGMMYGCSSQLNISDYVDTSKSFYFQEKTKSDSVLNIDKEEIRVGTEKYNAILNWIKQNTDGWSSSYASYITDASLFQNNFTLSYSENLVVVNLIEQGQPKQYVKNISKDELQFLSK